MIALVDESASYLYGTLAVELHAGGRPVPGWAWVSALAHAPADVITSWADRPESSAPAADGTTDRWMAALSVAAKEIIATAADADVGLDEVQRSVFLPMERRGTSVSGPDHLVRLSLRSLRQYQETARATRPRLPGNSRPQTA